MDTNFHLPECSGLSLSLASLMRAAAITCAMGVVFCLTEAHASAQSKTYLMPLGQLEKLATPSFRVDSWQAGAAYVAENTLVTALYQHSTISVEERDSRTAALDILFDKQSRKFDYLAVVKANSSTDKPTLDTFQGAFAAGYHWLDTAHWTFIAGAGVGFTDVTLRKEAPETGMLLPVPFLRIQTDYPLWQAKLDFVTSPNLSLQIMPTTQLRLNADVRFDQLRDSRDLLAEFTAGYRPFASQHALHEIVNFAVGFKNDAVSIGQFSRNTDLQYHSLFAVADFTFLKLTAGQTFNQRIRHEEAISADPKAGYFVSLEAMLAF